MKKLFFITAALIAAMSIRAAVVDIDLSKAQSTSSAGSSTLSYDATSGELTVNWTVTTDWEVSGVNIPLRSLTGIVRPSRSGVLRLMSTVPRRYWVSALWQTPKPPLPVRSNCVMSSLSPPVRETTP